MPAKIDKILRIHASHALDLDTFQEKELVLEAAAHVDNAAWALERLQEIVPTFRSSKTVGCPKEFETVEPSDEEALRHM